jgi:F0F1-type ATP synthase assembly protein I
MFRVVAIQFVTSLAVAVGAWAVSSRQAAVSSLLGGLACTLPNGLFALNLAWLGRHPRSGAVALLAGEFIKVVLTIGLLVTIARTVRDVVWSALIVAVIAVLLMQAAALVRR